MPSKTLSTTAEGVFLRNRLRKSWIIQNEDATINVFLKRERAETPTASSTDHDFLLAPGALLALNNDVDGAESIQDRWTAIAASGTPRVSFFETEDIVR